METLNTAPLCRLPSCVHWKRSTLSNNTMREEEKKNKDDVYVSFFIVQNEERRRQAPKAEQFESRELHRLPTWSEAMEEMKLIAKISGPTALTSLLLYSRTMISMMFLGYLGESSLAAGSLSIGFANVTGYSIIAGLSMGMEPICGQAFGAKRWNLLDLTLQRTILILLLSCPPLSCLWLNMENLLQWCGQDPKITSMAQIYITFLLPDLFSQALLHPLRIYLRAQGITIPLTTCAGIALLLHMPINSLLVKSLNLGLKGVALANVFTNCNLVLLLFLYVGLSGTHKRTLQGLSLDCFKGWKPLLNLAIPSCFSVCLEWWWYEFMIILCGLLSEPKPKVAAMGVLIQTTSLLYILPSSIGMGVSIRVGNELGANSPSKARRVMFVALLASTCLGFLSMCFAVGVSSVWGKMFTQDRDILSLTRRVLPIIGLCELFNCPQTTGCGILRGCARPSSGANINLGSFYLVGLPVALVLAFYLGLGFEGFWLGLLASEACCLLLMVCVLVRTDWVVEANRASTLTGVSSDESAYE